MPVQDQNDTASSSTERQESSEKVEPEVPAIVLAEAGTVKREEKGQFKEIS